MKITLLAFLPAILQAADFPALPQKIPFTGNVAGLAPVFDFDADSCLPAAAISSEGAQNPGTSLSGTITQGCRTSNFLQYSNTYHRHSCTYTSGTRCVHLYALYFEKDQDIDYLNAAGHVHDIEDVAIWTLNGVITHASYSAHGDLYTRPISNVPLQNGHVKIVYHKDGLSTHSFRFANSNEVAENPYGTFVTPKILNWVYGSSAYMQPSDFRNKLNSFSYGKASFKIKDSEWLTYINQYRPSGYPAFVL
eukprot:maker-scaffold_35-snap-gene-1.49-mRNA-1 protein AED:0.01 eAED:0.01 QI:376/1/1/1/1/1/2/229/249